MKDIVFRREVHPADIDNRVRYSGLYLKGGWAEAAKDEVRVDLSVVEWIDFDAAARLLAVIEGAARCGHQIRVILPVATLRASEAEFLTSSEKNGADTLGSAKRWVAVRIEARREARGFLKHTGFIEALHLAHLPALTRPPIVALDDEADEHSHVASTDGADVRPYPGRREGEQRAIYPFKWVTGENQGSWQEEAAEFLCDRGLVLTRSDAKSLVDTILSELVDNVRDHAPDAGRLGPPGALVGAITLNRSRRRYSPKPESFYPSEGPYQEWLSTQDSPIVRIIVADSGAGICRTISEEYGRRHGLTASEVSAGTLNARRIYFCFDPTASRHAERGRRRGVGLAGVDRYVRSYQGLVVVRSENACAGYSFERRSRAALQEDDLPYVPGTCVDVTLGLTLHAKGRVIDETSYGELEVVPVAVELSQFAEKAQELATGAATGATRRRIVLLVVSGWFPSGRSAMPFAIETGSVARELRGRAGLALLLPDATDDKIATSFSSVDDLRAEREEAVRRGWSIEAWTPPFLVVSAEGSSHWAGATEGLRGLMYTLWEGDRVSMASITGRWKLSQEDMDYIRTDSDWFRIGRDGLVGMMVRPNEIDEAIIRATSAALRAALGMAITVV